MLIKLKKQIMPDDKNGGYKFFTLIVFQCKWHITIGTDKATKLPKISLSHNGLCTYAFTINVFWTYATFSDVGLYEYVSKNTKRMPIVTRPRAANSIGCVLVLFLYLYKHKIKFVNDPNIILWET